MWRGTGHESCLIPGCGAPSRSAVQNILPGDGWILFLEICLHRPQVFSLQRADCWQNKWMRESRFFFFFLCLVNHNHFSFSLSFTKQEHESPPSKAKPTRCFFLTYFHPLFISATPEHLTKYLRQIDTTTNVWTSTPVHSVEVNGTPDLRHSECA